MGFASVHQIHNVIRIDVCLISAPKLSECFLVRIFPTFVGLSSIRPSLVIQSSGVQRLVPNYPSRHCAARIPRGSIVLIHSHGRSVDTIYEGSAVCRPSHTLVRSSIDSIGHLPVRTITSERSRAIAQVARCCTQSISAALPLGIKPVCLLIELVCSLLHRSGGILLNLVELLPLVIRKTVPAPVQSRRVGAIQRIVPDVCVNVGQFRVGCAPSQASTCKSEYSPQ